MSKFAKCYCVAAVAMCSLLLVAKAQVQDRSAGVRAATARAQHLRRGINASEWFSQSANDYSAKHTSTWMTDADIALMVRMGFDHVRLSIDATPLEQSPLGSDGLNAEFMARLDHALDTILANGLAVQVDLHPEEPFKAQVHTSSQAVDHLAALWAKLAAHYALRDPERVFFEIMNEPEENDPYRWASTQARVAAVIRKAAPRQTIIATGANYSGLADLLVLHPLADGNVIYNFHFYDPHTFTHQGATWGLPWWRYTHGIPYPTTEASRQASLNEVPDAASRRDMEQYWIEHWDGQRIRAMIDKAAAWGKANNVPLICNEFGVFRDHSDPVSRNAWIRDVRTALEADGIGWAMWDYRGGFGVVTKRDGEAAHPDASTMSALGLNDSRR